MTYVVQYLDTLPKIARDQLGDESRWHELAAYNGLTPPVLLYIGERLELPLLTHRPFVGRHSHRSAVPNSHIGNTTHHKPATQIPGRQFFFILADEVNPLRRKLVRRAIFPADARVTGFQPRDIGSNVTPGRHVHGMTNSKYISASEREFGARRHPGKSYWIDAETVEKNGGKIIEAPEIAKDIDRIINKTKKAETRSYLNDIKQKSLIQDREVLIEGGVPASAVKGVTEMSLTRGFQVVEGIGIILTAIDLSNAASTSYDERSVKPIAAETVRQAGGWGGALVGAEIGGGLGAAVGIETGPGAIITGAIGATIFGAIGYFDANWVANHIYKKK